MNPDEMLEWLGEKDPKKLQGLFKAARACAVAHVGPKVYFRGLIEFSNVCAKNCCYCGIRSGNARVLRYSMPAGEILDCAREAFEMGYGSVVLQAGERQGEGYCRLIEDLIPGIKALSGGKLGITLSLGEQSFATYERWFRAGAHRYLLRIETSNPGLYRSLHPEDHFFEARRNCLRSLKKAGYQTGTGVMIGLPGQTNEDLVNDILFFEREDIDMIGMGPYIPHEETPLAASGQKGNDLTDNLRLGLVMIALTRLRLKDVNITAATALQALDPTGYEQGICAGANIIMPNITPVKYREQYQLYRGKPCLDEDVLKCSGCLDRRIRSTGAEIGYREWGDSRHFASRSKVPARPV
jgi:biotin synthase